MLGRHVGDRAQSGSRAGEVLIFGLRVRVRDATGGGRAVSHLGQTEIEDLGVTAPGNEDIRGLDVTMDDAGSVRGIECIGDFHS